MYKIKERLNIMSKQAKSESQIAKAKAEAEAKAIAQKLVITDSHILELLELPLNHYHNYNQIRNMLFTSCNCHLYDCSKPALVAANVHNIGNPDADTVNHDIKGYYENVVGFDFNSRHPNTILENLKAGGHDTTKLAKLIALKNSLKGDHRKAIKKAINTLYGMMNFLHPAKEIAGSHVQKMGKYYILSIADKLPTPPLKIATDSIYVHSDLVHLIPPEIDYEATYSTFIAYNKSTYAIEKETQNVIGKGLFSQLESKPASQAFINSMLKNKNIAKAEKVMRTAKRLIELEPINSAWLASKPQLDRKLVIDMLAKKPGFYPVSMSTYSPELYLDSQEINFSNYRYYTPNTLKEQHSKKAKKNYTPRRAIVVEYDSIKGKIPSLETQYKKFKKTPKPSYILWSGSKSLHATYIFDRDLTKQENELLESYMIDNFPDSDNSVWKLNQWVRVPNATRENGKVQKLIEVNSIIDTNDFLKRYSCKVHATKSCNVVNAVRPVQEANISVSNDFLDSIIATIPAEFKQSDNSDYYGFTSHCPFSENHTNCSSNSSEFIIQVFKDSGVIKASCKHDSCKDIATPDFLRALEIPIPQLENNSNNEKSGIDKDYQSLLDEVANITLLESDIYKPLNNAASKSIVEALNSDRTIICSAGTGSGKTYNSCKYISQQISRTNNNFLFITDTVKSVYDVIRELIKNDTKRSDICIYTSSNRDTQIKYFERFRAIVTTHAYLGLQGHSSTVYKCAAPLLQGRIVIADEAASLYNRCKIAFSLSTRYKQVNTMHLKQSICPRKNKKGGCSNCSIAARFIENAQLKSYKHAATLENLSFEHDLFSNIARNYTHIKGNLFAHYLDEQKLNNYELETDEEGYNAYIKTLLRTSYNPLLLRQQVIELDKDKEIVKAYTHQELVKLHHAYIEAQELKLKTDESKLYAKLQFPRSGFCDAETFACIDRIPFLQLLSNAKRVIFLSATFEQENVDLIQDVFKLSNNDICIAEDVKMKFNVNILTTKNTISKEVLTKAVEKLSDKCTESLIVFPTMNKAKRFYKDSSMNLKNVLALTSIDSTFEADEVLLHGSKKSAKIKHVVSYVNSPYTQGTNIPNCNLVVVDGSCFKPLSALSIQKGATKESIAAKLLDVKNKTIAQVVGRALRSNLEYRDGELQIDDSKEIVIVIYNMESEFHVHPQLVNRERVIRNFMHKNDKVNSLVNNINAIWDNPDNPVIIDYLQIEQNQLKNKKQSELTKRERSIVKAGTKQLSKSDKKKLLKEKAIAMLKTETFREVSRILHLSRHLKPQEIAKLSKLATII